MKYGVYLNGLLINIYDTKKEAEDMAMFAQQETGTFHGVKVIEDVEEKSNSELKLQPVDNKERIDYWMNILSNPNLSRDNILFVNKYGN